MEEREGILYLFLYIFILCFKLFFWKLCILRVLFILDYRGYYIEKFGFLDFWNVLVI